MGFKSAFAKRTLIAGLIATASLAGSLAFAHERGGIPPFLKDKLTAEQQEQFKAAKTREEKDALLSSWGIDLPPRPVRPNGPPPEGFGGRRRDPGSVPVEDSSGSVSQTGASSSSGNAQ